MAEREIATGEKGKGLESINYPFPNYENGDIFFVITFFGIHNI